MTFEERVVLHHVDNLTSSEGGMKPVFIWDGLAPVAPPTPLSFFLSHSQTHIHTHTLSRSDSEAGSYSRLIDFVYHSTLGLIVIKKKKMMIRL